MIWAGCHQTIGQGYLVVLWGGSCCAGLLGGCVIDGCAACVCLCSPHVRGAAVSAGTSWHVGIPFGRDPRIGEKKTKIKKMRMPNRECAAHPAVRCRGGR